MATHNSPRPSGPDESRAIPPHGPVSPAGDRAWPQPSQTARMVVYGGVVLAAAGLTAGVVLLGRKLAGSDKPAPAAIRAAAIPEPVQPPPRPRRRRKSALRLHDLTHAVQDATAFIAMAMAGFRAVAENVQGLGTQFRSIADAWHGEAAQAESAQPRGGAKPDAADGNRPHHS